MLASVFKYENLRFEVTVSLSFGVSNLLASTVDLSWDSLFVLSFCVASCIRVSEVTEHISVKLFLETERLNSASLGTANVKARFMRGVFGGVKSPSKAVNSSTFSDDPALHMEPLLCLPEQAGHGQKHSFGCSRSQRIKILGT